MNSSQHPLQSVLANLCVPVREDGKAHILALTSTHSGVGTSYVARELAILAAQHYTAYGQRVALIDLDIAGLAQYAYFSQRNEFMPQESAISLQGPYDATFGCSPFWQVSPDNLDDMGVRKNAALYGAMYLVGETGLTITKFNWDELKEGQNVHLSTAPEYWAALRDNFALVIVDTPAFDRSDTALTVIPEADKTVLVTEPNRASDPALQHLSDKILHHHGHCAGLVVNEGPNILDLHNVI